MNSDKRKYCVLPPYNLLPIQTYLLLENNFNIILTQRSKVTMHFMNKFTLKFIERGYFIQLIVLITAEFVEARNLSLSC